MNATKFALTRNARLLLIIIPAIYIVLSYYFNSIQGLFSIRSVDPEYVYLISGLNIANLKFYIGHIDHPGSPLQYLLAVCFRIIYFFKTSELPFWEDVLVHSESYLKTSNLVLNSLITGFMAFAGYKCFQITKNMGYAILIQTTPFITQITFDTFGRIVPEPLMLIPALLLCLILLGIIEGKFQTNSIKTTLWFGIVSGLALSIKLTCLPLWLIPFIIISKWKNKFLFILFAILSFLVISIPVTLNMEVFWNWSKGLFLHSENYGGGENNIVNLQKFYPQILKIIDANTTFFLFVLSLLLITIFHIITRRFKEDNHLIKISFALIATVIIQLLFVGKHFGYRYYIPALYLFPAIVITAVTLLSQTLKTRHFTKISSIGIGLFLIIAVFHQYSIFEKKSTYLKSDNERKMPLFDEFKKLDSTSIKLIIPASNGSAAKEYALYFAYAYSGNKQKPLYKSILADLYPNSYLFLPWDETLHYWNNFDLQKTIKENIPVYIIAQDVDEEKIQIAINKFSSECGFDANISTTQIFQSPNYNSGIYTFKLNTATKIQIAK